MKDEEITKEQLLAELDKLRQENKELKIAQIEGKGIPKLSEWSSPSRWFSAGRPELIISQWPEPQPAVDHLEKYKFSDLVDIPFIQQLLDSFYFATGIPYGLQDENNNILCGIGWQDICTQFHRLCPQTECRCKQSDRYIAAHLRDRAYVGYKCMNGLMDYGTLIIVEDQHLATIFLGQFLHQPPEEDFFRRQAQEYGFDEEAYLEALRQVPIIPEEQIESIMRFYSQLGRFLATMGLERKSQLEAAEQKFAKAFQCNPDLMVISTLDEGRYVEVNDAFVEITGYTRDETIGHTAPDTGIWPVAEERDRLVEKIRKNGSVRDFEIQLRLKSGKIRIFSLNGEIIDLEGVPHLLNSSRDITESKQMMEELSFSEECFAKAFNVSPVLMAVTSLNAGRIIKVNDAFCRILGYSHEELIGRTTFDIGFWADLSDRYRVQHSLKGKQSIHDIEIHFRKKNGEQRLGLYSAERLDVDNEPCILGLMTDITDLRQMEVEMTRLDRLNLVGEMAASLGHEIRNPMTTVRGYLQILRENRNYMQEIDHFDLMIEELDRANSIITEFLSLAKNKLIEMTPQNLNSIISASVPLIMINSVSQNQHVKLEMHELPDLLLDRKEIRQLIMNLVNNGMESMSLTGEVTIRTFVEKETVVLAVQDQGHGIDNDILDKLGTPFFTTKEQGTGLGLAVCYRIASRHNARIDIQTSSRGSTFYVRFPIPIIDATVG